MHPDSARDTASILGELLDDAVANAVDRTDYSEQDARALLDTITVESQVSAKRLEAVLGETATYVSTPETRLEFAQHTLEDLRELTAPHDDVPTVATRQADIEARFDAIDAAVTDLGADLQTLIADVTDVEGPDDLLAAIDRVHTVRDRADRLAGRADELGDDIDGFERWLKVPVARHEAIELGLDDLEQTLDGFPETNIETLQTAHQRRLARHHRVLSLVLDDIRQELGDVRTLDHRADADTAETLDALVFRLDDLARSHQSLEPPRDALDDETVADLEALDDAFAPLDAPIDWAEVDTVVASPDSEDGPVQST